MDSGQDTLATQLAQLRKARTLVLQDAVFWPRIFTGILPIVSASDAAVEIRRWGAEFLAETFSTPTLNEQTKTDLALTALDPLVGLIHEKEAEMLKHVIQCCASIYPLIFRHTSTNRSEATAWQKMGILKQRILSLWDVGPAGVKICCIKFVQRAIQVQTPGVTDPRLANRSEISLAIVPQNHPLLSIPTLEAEAQGLLDRLLGVFNDEPIDPLLITSTLNCISILIKTRSSLSNKILNVVYSFNPLALAQKDPTPRNKLLAKCIEKTVRVLVLNLIRASPNGPHSQKLTQLLTRMNAANRELFDDASRKRPAAAPPQAQAVESAKRQRTETVTPPIPTSPNRQMIITPKTYAELYTLASDSSLTSFDVQQLPLEIIVQITLATFFAVNQQALESAVAAIRARLQALNTVQPATQQFQASQPDQPALQPPHIEISPVSTTLPLSLTAVAEETSVVSPDESKGKMIGDFEDDEELEAERIERSFRLATPPYPSDEQRLDAARANIDRLFTVLSSLERTALVQRKNKGGLIRVAASSWDKDGWITMITRLATRGLGACDVEMKEESGNVVKFPSPIGQYIRERLLQYIVGDFRANLDSAVAWLYEEWYNDNVMSSLPMAEGRVKQYPLWLMKVVDGILPFVESRDRLVIRFLSEVPELSRDVLNKVKVLCLDPDRSSLGLQILQYNAMLRPPVREMCCDLFEDFFYNHKELANQCKKFLERWRPLTIQPAPSPNLTNNGQYSPNGIQNTSA